MREDLYDGQNGLPTLKNMCPMPRKSDRRHREILRNCAAKEGSSLVSFTDKEEVARVRNNFLKKKLGLTNSDTELDKAIMLAAEKMKGDRTKNWVTVYYLLADHFEKLSMFG